MSKRQALGTISLNNHNGVHNKGPVQPPVGFGKQQHQQADSKQTTNKFCKTQSFSAATMAAASALLGKIKPSNSLNKLNNDENSTSSHKFNKPAAATTDNSSEADFEIFTENCQISFPSKRHPSTSSSSSSSGASSCMYDFFINDDKENSICEKKKPTSSEQLLLDEKSVDMILESPILFEETIKSTSAINHVLSDEEECSTHEEEEEDDEATRREQESELTLFDLIDYKRDCIDYMRKFELQYRPNPNYIKKQVDITSSMRAILIDWLVEVAEEYKLQMETLYLAVSYTDRFLSQSSVLRSRLQLVGTASMYIASKYEEITPPDLSEFVYITDDTYKQDQVIRMEQLLLKTLNFRMSRPTANWFLNAYLSEIKLHECESKCGGGVSSGQMSTDVFQRVEYLARYLAELTLLDCEIFLAYLPSQIAASAIYLAMYTLLERPWSSKTAELTGYKFDLSELKPCIWDLFKWYKKAKELPQQAIQEKYKQASYEHISLVDPPSHLPACFYTNV